MLIEEYEVDPNQVGYEGKTALHYAAENCSMDVIRLLIEKGAKFTKNERDKTAVDLFFKEMKHKMTTALSDPSGQDQEKLEKKNELNDFYEWMQLISRNHR